MLEHQELGKIHMIWKIIIKFFSRWDPFAVFDVLASLSTGITGDESINCHNSVDVGSKMMANIVGKYFVDLKFQRKYPVVPLN